MNVSVVIVTHNRPHHIKACISSILANTRRPKEIIVVDDSDAGRGSAQSVRGLAYPGKITLIYRRIKKHRGVSYSRNIGIKASTGDIVAFLDDDCAAFPDWVEAMIYAHSMNRRADAITGYVLPAHANNYWNRVLFRFHSDQSQRPRETDFLFGANYSFKRRVFDRDKFFFNECMIHCSEDRYISYVLKKHNRLLLYDPRIKVHHEFRTSRSHISKQWLRYGIGDYYLWKLMPDYHENPDSDYFRKKTSFGTFFIAPLRSLYRIFCMLRALRVRLRDAYIVPGLVFIYAVYYLGIYRALCEDHWPDIFGRTSSNELLS